MTEEVHCRCFKCTLIWTHNEHIITDQGEHLPQILFSIYATMGELAEYGIHHVLECGAPVLETERRAMERMAAKESNDRGLRYVSWVYRHLKVSFKQVQRGEDTCTFNHICKVCDV